MNAPTWASAAAGLVFGLVRDLLGDLRKRAPEIAVEEAARRIADAVMAAPLAKLPPALHAKTHMLMAETLVDSLADVAGLSDKTRKRLRDRVGRKLLNATADKLDKAADELLAKTDKWERLLK